MSLLLLRLLAFPVWAGLLSAGGIFVKDTTGADRTQFSNNERINLQVRVSNAAASAGRIRFTFRVLNPAGSEVFRHSGNSVPGTVGNSASQVSGVPVSQFFTGPGLYTFSAEAVLDAQTVTQTAQFALSSPNILLIYPPNGARDVPDRPLTFRWTASGASRYRVTVGDNAALYNAVFSEATSGPEGFLSYPENPADSRARLAAGQVYYWKVEGLDAAGNVVAQSDLPFNFTAQTAALTRDLAVTALDATGRSGDTVSFLARVANQGGTTESNVPLRLSLGGLPAEGSPVTLPQMRPGDAREYPFNAVLPADQGQSLAIACLDFFDDSVPNNCKSLQVTRLAASGGSGFGPATPLTRAELEKALAEKLKGLGLDPSVYDLDGFVAGLSEAELKSLLDQLGRGQAQVTIVGPPPGTSLPPSYIPPPVSAPPPSSSGTAEVDAAELEKAVAKELEALGLDSRVYDIPGFLKGFSGAEQAALLDALRRGQARVTVVGPPPGTAVPPAVIPPPVSAAPLLPAAPDALGREWTGKTGADFGAGAQAFLREDKAFRRLWRRLSTEDAPDLDFKEVMVVAVVAEDGAERVEIEDVFEAPSGLVVRYRVTAGSGAAGPADPRRRAGAPYILKVVRTSGLEPDFRRAGREER